MLDEVELPPERWWWRAAKAEPAPPPATATAARTPAITAFLRTIGAAMYHRFSPPPRSQTERSSATDVSMPAASVSVPGTSSGSVRTPNCMVPHSDTAAILTGCRSAISAKE